MIQCESNKGRVKSMCIAWENENAKWTKKKITSDNEKNEEVKEEEEKVRMAHKRFSKFIFRRRNQFNNLFSNHISLHAYKLLCPTVDEELLCSVLVFLFFQISLSLVVHVALKPI